MPETNRNPPHVHSLCFSAFLFLLTASLLGLLSASQNAPIQCPCICVTQPRNHLLTRRKHRTRAIFKAQIQLNINPNFLILTFTLQKQKMRFCFTTSEHSINALFLSHKAHMYFFFPERLILTQRTQRHSIELCFNGLKFCDRFLVKFPF